MLGGGAALYGRFLRSRCTDGCHERIIRGNQSDHICIPSQVARGVSPTVSTWR